MAKIAIDCDGVLANFTSAFADVGNKLWPGRVPDGWEPSDWNFGGKFTEAESSQIWDVIRATSNFWLGLRAYSDSVVALSRFLMSSFNQDVWICTSREPTAGYTVARQTDMWLGSCGVRPILNFLSIVPVPNSNNKAKLYELMGVEYSIDDKTETVEDCDDIGSLHKAYLLDRPWNQDAKVRQRVKSVAAFLAEVK